MSDQHLSTSEESSEEAATVRPEPTGFRGRNPDAIDVGSLENRAEAAARELAVSQRTVARQMQRSRALQAILEAVRGDLHCTAALEARKASGREEFTREEREWLAGLAEQSHDRGSRMVERLPDSISEALREVGLQVDAGARHPRYTVAHGFITAEVDDRQLMAAVTSRGGRPRRLPADAPAIAAEMKSLHDRLFGPGRPRLSMEDVYAAYLGAVTRNGVAPGVDVPVDDVRIALRPEGARPMPLDEFNVDLAALLKVGSGTAVKMSVANTRQTERGILLHGMDQSGYVGYLRMEERNGA